MDAWVQQAVDLLDAWEIEQDGPGGQLVWRRAGAGPGHPPTPQRVRRLVLMGSVGVPFEITPGLDAVWGYTPSLENMRGLLDIFALQPRRWPPTSWPSCATRPASSRVSRSLCRHVPRPAPALGGRHGQPARPTSAPAHPTPGGARPRRPGDSACQLADAGQLDPARSCTCLASAATGRRLSTPRALPNWWTTSWPKPMHRPIDRDDHYFKSHSYQPFIDKD
jgi:hypothetical protein